ncbi:MAG TPA: ATP-binding protein [Lacibacter sp.]|nr:ATP-binding protein [Lacibacter sp.]HMO90202.1 ATP-binding protein [Lacibacter sp.]
MEKEKEQNMLEAYRRFMHIGLNGGDPELLRNIVDEHISGFGSALDEKIIGFDGLKKLLHTQIEQSEGLAITWRSEPVFRYTATDENTAVFADDVYLCIKTGEDTVEMYLRFSAVLNYTGGQWKVIHWHGSKPEAVESGKDTWGVENWKQRTAELEKLVAEKTTDLTEKNRELEIETALEKVRAVAMGMQAPDDMLEVCRVMCDQLVALGVSSIRNVQTAVFYSGKKTYLNYEYYREPLHKVITEVAYAEQPDVRAFAEKMLRDPQAFFTTSFEGDKLREWNAYQQKAGQYLDPHQYEADAIHFYFYSIGPGALGLSAFAPLDEVQISLLQRLRNVFELAYRRFSDIELALSQAREAQIEGALERVRSRAMAMQDSSALSDIIFNLYGELTKLDAKLDRCFIMIVHPESNGITWWMTGHEGLLAENGFFVQMNQHPSHLMYLDYCKKRKKKWTYLFEGEEKREWDRFGFSKTELAKLPEPIKVFMAAAEKVHLSGSSDQFGSLVTGSFEPLPEEQQEIISRFAVAFNQAYIRFLDLQKAEAQAREAEIQLALERVRARSLAMHHTNELQEVVNVAAQQLLQMGIEIDGGVFIAINDEVTTDFPFWAAAGATDYVQKVTIPFFDRPTFTGLRDAILQRRPFYTDFHSIGEKNAFLNHLFRYHPWNQNSDERKAELLAREGGYTRSVVINQHTSIGIINHHGKRFSDAENDILRRFGAVLEQSYTRFLDLQRAEVQAREAQIEAGLERVRSRSLAMHKSEELNEVVTVLFEKLKDLSIPVSAVGISITIPGSKDLDNYTCGQVESGVAINNYRLPYFDHRIANDFFEAREKQLEFFVGNYSKQEKDSFYAYVIEHTALKNELTADVKQFIFQSPSYSISVVTTKHTMITLNDFEGGSLSDNEIDVLKRFSKVFEQAYVRFLDLQKAETQAREAQIEAALERVRARSMAMHKSEELSDLSLELVKQVQALGVATWFCAFNIYDDDPAGSMEWGSNGQGVFSKYRTPREGVFLRYYEAGQRGETLLVNEIGEEECPDHYAYLCSLPGVGDQLLQMKAAGIPFPKCQIDHVAFFRHGYILFITYEAVPETHDIFKRFAKVFEQTYTRFLDLQKAEAQAREAQVERSLERIRAHVTSMQKSSDLFDIVVSMRREFVALGHQADYFWHMRWAPEHYELSMTSDDGSRLGMVINVPKFVHEQMPRLYEWEKGNSPIIVLPLNADEAWDYVDKMNTYGSFELIDPHAPGEEDIRHIGGLTFIIARTTHGEIGYSLAGEVYHPPKESQDTLIRFAGVFDLAYKRFEDLKEAEKRNRETQIDLALERTRTQSMRMQHSGELLDISKVFHEQLLFLHMDAEFSFVWLPDEENGNHLFWATWMEEQEGQRQFHTKAIAYPLDMTEPYTAACFNDWRSGVSVHEHFIEPEAVPVFFASWEELLAGAEALKPANFPDGIFYTEAFMRYGCFGIDTRRPLSQQEKEILHRFAVEFERAYTRFLDLKKAEEQAREAQIEAALEKVRSRSLAMQQPNELAEVAELLRNEMGQLGVEELETSSIYIVDKEHEQAECWYAIKDIREKDKRLVSDEMAITFADTWVGREMWKFYRSRKEYTSIVMNGDNRKEWINYCAARSTVLQGYYGDEIPERTYHLVKFQGGYMGAASPGAVSAESWDLLRRAAAVFSLAYTRFNDLQVAAAHALQAEKDLVAIKEAKQKAEEALTELQATQKQLIQAEKMASLGELTAGIAHEIQNPLNFVNNFSEVSKELMDEMREAIEKGDMAGARDIMQDVMQNLEKINHHGKRADGIVKGMLQHSRSSTGQKEMTDINALCDEYLRLAFHGLRAKEKSFNARFETSFDASVGNVIIMPQELGRVVLNLINNAFYAVNERKKYSDSRYEPVVFVSTRKTNSHIEITVRDNGTGMPESVKGKIFQPFFTTKPTGQGTGLGLSLSYDIITKGHNGTLQVDSEEGEGTSFVIQLPLS